MIVKLTELQLIMLRTAATRDDKCVEPPTTLRGALLHKTGKKLIECDYVREIKAKSSSPLWRRDAATEVAYALKLTPAGTKAAKQAEAPADLPSPSSGPANLERRSAPSPVADRSAPTPNARPESDKSADAQLRKSPVGAPRAGSKIATVIRMLEGESGATLLDLISATGWLPHTTRAALTGLRKRGYKVTSDRTDRERGSVYKIESGPANAIPQPAVSVAEAP